MLVLLVVLDAIESGEGLGLEASRVVNHHSLLETWYSVGFFNFFLFSFASEANSAWSFTIQLACARYQMQSGEATRMEKTKIIMGTKYPSTTRKCTAVKVRRQVQIQHVSSLSVAFVPYLIHICTTYALGFRRHLIHRIACSFFARTTQMVYRWMEYFY